MYYSKNGYICVHKYTGHIWTLCTMFAISVLLPCMGKVLEKFVLKKYTVGIRGFFSSV